MKQELEEDIVGALKNLIDRNGVTKDHSTEVRLDTHEKRIGEMGSAITELNTTMVRMKDDILTRFDAGLKEVANRAAPNMQNVWAMLSVLMVVIIAFLGLLCGFYVREQDIKQDHSNREADRLKDETRRENDLLTAQHNRDDDRIQAQVGRLLDAHIQELNYFKAAGNQVSPAAADAMLSGKITIAKPEPTKP